MDGRPGLRWTAASDGQLALFDAPERIIGRGEYRGLEFVHVQARIGVAVGAAAVRVRAAHDRGTPGRSLTAR